MSANMEKTGTRSTDKSGKRKAESDECHACIQQRESTEKQKLWDAMWIKMLEERNHPVIAQVVNQGATNTCTRFAFAYVMLAAVQAIFSIEMDVNEMATVIMATVPCFHIDAVSVSAMLNKWTETSSLQRAAFFNKQKTAHFHVSILRRCQMTFDRALRQMEVLQQTHECVLVVELGKGYDKKTQLRVDHCMAAVAVRIGEDGKPRLICVNSHGEKNRFVYVPEENFHDAFHIEFDIHDYHYLSDDSWERLDKAPISTEWSAKVDEIDSHRDHYRKHGY